MKRKTTEEYINLLKNLNRNIICLGNYISINKKIQHKCLICGYTSDIRPLHVIRGNYGCANCSGIRKKTNDEYLIDLHRINPNMKPLEKYISARKKIKHVCLVCNNVSEYIPNNLLNGQGCQKCANNQKIGTEKYKIKLKQKNKKNRSYRRIYK